MKKKTGTTFYLNIDTPRAGPVLVFVILQRASSNVFQAGYEISLIGKAPLERKDETIIFDTVTAACNQWLRNHGFGESEFIID